MVAGKGIEHFLTSSNTLELVQLNIYKALYIMYRKRPIYDPLINVFIEIANHFFVLVAHISIHCSVYRRMP